MKHVSWTKESWIFAFITIGACKPWALRFYTNYCYTSKIASRLPPSCFILGIAAIEISSENLSKNFFFILVNNLLLIERWTLKLEYRTNDSDYLIVNVAYNRIITFTFRINSIFACYSSKHINRENFYAKFFFLFRDIAIYVF